MGAYDGYKREGMIMKDCTDSRHEGLALIVDDENSEFLIADFYDSGVMVNLYEVTDIMNILPDTKINLRNI